MLAQIIGELSDIKAVQRKQGEDIAKLQLDVAKLQQDTAKLQLDFARVDGRLGELSARIPTIWTIATLIFAIFGASFVLIRFASGH